jgi:outer membrane protein OmpA-like peptidoglycan-associated protein/tetratricopeptide (TPR) repeat protein
MKTILILLLTLTTPVCFTQTQSDLANVDDLYLNQHFAASWPYYKQQLSKDPNNKELNYKMGVCYLNSRSQKQKALIYFTRAYADLNKENEKNIDLKQLADACYYASKFDEAIANYSKYQKILFSKKDLNLSEIKLIDLKISICYMGKEIGQLRNLVDSFTKSSRTKDSGLVSPTIAHEDEFFESTEIDPQRKTDIPLHLLDSTNFLKEATVATSVDGQIMLIYRNEDGESNLYASGLIGNEWTLPHKVQKSIDNKGWEPNEFISDDGNTMYFSFEREGGYGGKDIYKCKKLPNGEWGKAQNLGPDINSSCDEEAPYIHSDGKVLFFSSNRYKTKGGFDIFSSCLSDSGKWSAPLCTGYPIAKHPEPLDSAGQKKVDKHCFMATFIDQKKNHLSVIKGHIAGKDGKIPPYIEIVVTNNKSGEVSGIYSPNPETGEYLFVLPQEDDVNITYRAKGMLFHSENITTTQVENYALRDKVVLAPLAKGSKETLNNIFFEANTASLTPTSEIELKTLFEFLDNNKNVNLELATHISKKSKEEEVALEQNRLNTVRNYLLAKGIKKERIDTNIYKLKEKAIKRANMPCHKMEIEIKDIKNT